MTQFSLKKFFLIALGTSVVSSIFLTVILLTRNQDNRSRASESTPTVKLVVEKSVYNLSDLFHVDIVLDTKGLNIISASYTLSYDPTILDFLSFDSDNIYDTQLTPNSITEKGKFAYLGLDSKGEIHNGLIPLGKIVFKGYSVGESTIRISSIEIADEKGIVSIDNVAFTSVGISSAKSPEVSPFITRGEQSEPSPVKNLPAGNTSASDKETSTTIDLTPNTQPTSKVEPTSTSNPAVQPTSDTTSTNQQNNTSNNSSFWNFFKKSPTPTSTPSRTNKTVPNPTTASQTQQTQPAQNTNTSCATKIRGDANCDGKINTADLNVWKTETASQKPQSADFNSDGKADLSDYLIWRKNAL